MASEKTKIIIKCCSCKKVYIESTQALNNRVPLYKRSIKLPENRKLYVSKYLYECTDGTFKIMHEYKCTHTHHTNSPLCFPFLKCIYIYLSGLTLSLFLSLSIYIYGQYSPKLSWTHLIAYVLV